jgi:hypothetical protein
MTKASVLVARFRHDTGDLKAPFLFATPDVLRWLSEAEDEACKRGDLIREDSDGSMCALAVAAAGRPAPLNPLWLRIDSAVWVEPAEDADSDPQRTNLRILTDRKVLDRESSTWRYDSGDPSTLLVEGRQLRLVDTPDTAGTLYLEGFRLPKQPLAKDVDEPEIASVHHLELVNWALKLAFERPDSETLDPQRAKRAEDAFSAYFGPPRDREQWQETEVAHVNQVSPI